MKKLNKEILFKNYVETALEVFWYLENYFGGESTYKGLVGVDSDNRHEPASFNTAQEHMKGTWAWGVLSDLYDYAVFGIASSGLTDLDLVSFAEEIMNYMDTGDHCLSGDWTNLLKQADGRFGLDNCNDLDIETLALLASVDVRTVRNAISAGDLVSEKRNGTVYVDNKSGREWLLGRRGFKPTVHALTEIDELADVKTASEFGSFLAMRRENVGQSISDKKMLVFHSAVNANAIDKLESGVFSLPFDAIYPLADFYQLDRKEFLVATMKVFFHDEYLALTDKQWGINNAQ